ncbi:H-NS family nucleoid-associated regulatory protein [Rubellimicrobium aerolatum]|uniref:H-NS family nucleoid-associated regulatory protein n=1 Tax=Rubellimicrobium aerolatum TaxID=490979 RepID=A0ABW0SEN1_9RHOB|nr:H-NS histone family protein [Rubellimicrobium aerolatum]MBP1806925.1 DNA-binding protein H-NS [Rubellimicrobium aerolatum]
MSDEPVSTRLSPQKLHAMQSAVAREIREREARHKALLDLRATIEMAVKRWDFTPEELALPERRRTFGTKLPPKFRDPRDGTRVWSGRGRAPQWFKDALAAGLTVEDLTVPPE